MPPISPILALILGVLAASASSVLIRFAQAEAPSIVIAAYRLALATLILIPINLFASKGHRPLFKGRTLYIGSSLAGVFLALHFATWITSLEYTTIASSVAFVQMAPLFVVIFSPLLLREFPDRTIVIGLVIAIVGGFIIAISDSCMPANNFACPPLAELLNEKSLRGDLLALAGGAAGAIYLMIGRRVRGSTPLLPYITLVYGIAAVILILWAVLAGDALFGYSHQALMLFLLLAVIPQLFAHSTYNWVLKYLTATTVSISLLGEPVAATLLAMIILKEIPSAVRIMGAILVLIGITITLLWSGERE
ncbi:MAG: DMT family transporter [Anaerolineales bacterium]